MEKEKMIAILIIVVLTISLIMYIDYRNYLSKEKEINKQIYPYVRDTLLYTEGFVVALENITKIELVNNEFPSYYNIYYRVNKNKWGAFTMNYRDFKKIERYLPK